MLPGDAALLQKSRWGYTFVFVCLGTDAGMSDIMNMRVCLYVHTCVK